MQPAWLAQSAQPNVLQSAAVPEHVLREVQPSCSQNPAGSSQGVTVPSHTPVSCHRHPGWVRHDMFVSNAEHARAVPMQTESS